MTIVGMVDAAEPTPVIPTVPISRPDPLDRNATAADRLINAVICLLVEQGTHLLAEALTPEEVTKRAGKSRSSYYRAEGFPAADSLSPDARVRVLEETIAQVLLASARGGYQASDDIAEYLSQDWQAMSPRQFVAVAAARNFTELHHYSLIVQILAAALAPSSPSVSNSLGNYYREVTRGYAEGYEAIFGFLQYRFKPPVTSEKFATVLMALAEGLMMRRFGGADVDQDVFAELVGVVVEALTVADGDLAPEHLPPEHDLPGVVSPPSRADVIAALTRWFASERASLPTVGELARAAGCTEHAIRTGFGGVVGVVRAAWDEWLTEFEEVAERTRLTSRKPDPLEAAYRVTLAVATRAAEQPSITRALLISEIGAELQGAARDPGGIIGILERMLREAGELDLFRPPVPRYDEAETDRYLLFAHVLRNALLSAVTTRTAPAGCTPAEHARWCAEYVWAVHMPARAS